MSEFYLKELHKLIGGRIIGTATDEENEFFGVVIAMPGKKNQVLFFLRDDEGNGPGSFEIQEA